MFRAPESFVSISVEVKKKISGRRRHIRFDLCIKWSNAMCMHRSLNGVVPSRAFEELFLFMHPSKDSGLWSILIFHLWPLVT